MQQTYLFLIYLSGVLHQQDGQVVVLACQLHKMNVKQQWQLWLLRQEEYLDVVW
jgi:hypothetical protein